jgi:hydroxypyruvate reductase
MAAAFEQAWGEPCEGLVITRYGHSTPTRWVETIEASHPVPDAAGLNATARVLDLARSAGEDDLVVVLISGGASSLMTLPIEGVSLEDKQEITRQLLKSGAPISAINRVRKSLSAVKGGKLALAAAPAKVITYVISDVPGDNPAVVGSGPSIIEPPSLAEAIEILHRFEIELPPGLLQSIEKADAMIAPLEGGLVHVIANPRMALTAAAQAAREMGFFPIVLGDAIEGEAREVATVMAGITQSVIQYGTPVQRPCVILSGGETTVTVRGDGRGGRNAEFLLALAVRIQGLSGVAAIACDTDGIDGSEDNAGAWFDEDFGRQSDKRDQMEFLWRNDAYTYFKRLGQLTFTGPTLTNVNDFRAILVQ